MLTHQRYVCARSRGAVPFRASHTLPVTHIVLALHSLHAAGDAIAALCSSRAAILTVRTAARLSGHPAGPSTRHQTRAWRRQGSRRPRRVRLRRVRQQCKRVRVTCAAVSLHANDMRVFPDALLRLCSSHTRGRRTVAELGRDDQLALAAGLHGRHAVAAQDALVPALDDLSHADLLRLKGRRAGGAASAPATAYPARAQPPAGRPLRPAHLEHQGLPPLVARVKHGAVALQAAGVVGADARARCGRVAAALHHVTKLQARGRRGQLAVSCGRRQALLHCCARHHGARAQQQRTAVHVLLGAGSGADDGWGTAAGGGRRRRLAGREGLGCSRARVVSRSARGVLEAVQAGVEWWRERRWGSHQGPAPSCRLSVLDHLHGCRDRRWLIAAGRRFIFACCRCQQGRGGPPRACTRPIAIPVILAMQALLQGGGRAIVRCGVRSRVPPAVCTFAQHRPRSSHASVEASTRPSRGCSVAASRRSMTAAVAAAGGAAAAGELFPTLVSAEWLGQHLGEVKVLNATW